MQIKTLFKLKNEDFTTTKFIILVILAPIALMVFDALIGFIFYRIRKELVGVQMQLFGYFLYLSLGLWIATGFYKFVYINRKKLVSAVIIATIILIVIKYLFAVNYINSELGGLAIKGALVETFTVLFRYVFLLLFFYEQRIKFILMRLRMLTMMLKTLQLNLNMTWVFALNAEH